MEKPSADAPRREHELYALEHGYFWLSCPRCGRMFGGHEKSGESVPYGQGRSLIACCNSSCCNVQQPNRLCEDVGSPWDWEAGCHSTLKLFNMCDDDCQGRMPRCALVEVSYGQLREWRCNVEQKL